MDLALLGHDIIVANTGALGLLIGQRIRHWQITWKCPYCKPPHRFTATCKDPETREMGAEVHLRDFHPEVAQKTRP